MCNLGENDISLGGFPHYMIKEIYEQPSILGKICNTYIDENNQLFRKEISTDMRGWNPSAVTTICTDIEMQNCYVYLSALRKKDERIIYFANPSDRSGRVFLGQFLETK